ncbi:MAG: hypothetical protein ACRETS_04300, partial [Steroidobacteraceae bacterium]
AALIENNAGHFSGHGASNKNYMEDIYSLYRRSQLLRGAAAGLSALPRRKLEGEIVIHGA